MTERVEQPVIETMQASDMEAVLRIDRLSFPLPWMPEAFLTELKNRSARYFVARIAGEIVGFGGVWVILEAHITTLAVDPLFRGRKIGEQLLIALLEEGLRRRARRATLEVRRSNHTAQQLYRKYGFHEAMIRRNYYMDNQEDALVMWADNIQTPLYRALLHQLRDSLNSDDG